MPLSQIVSASIEDGAVAPVDLSSVAQYTGFKNRIINGSMAIDQRNNGASTTTDASYNVDRFLSYMNTGTITRGQSSTAPAGFAKSLSYTVTVAGTRNAANYAIIQQCIEANNITDLAMGTSSASTFTVSFWARSSIAGLYSGSINSSDNARCYPFTYTIDAANTFEYKTITIPGDGVAGAASWSSGGTGAGMLFRLDLGSGSNYQGTAGSWQVATNLSGTAGTVSWVTTLGATFYVTGIQIEKGITATSFDVRPYGTELNLCMRYYQNIGGNFSGVTEGTTTFSISVPYYFDMRIVPTIATRTGYYFNARYAGGDVNIISPTLANVTPNINGVWLQVATSGRTANFTVVGRNQNTVGLNEFLSANSDF